MHVNTHTIMRGKRAKRDKGGREQRDEGWEGKGRRDDEGREGTEGDRCKAELEAQIFNLHNNYELH